MTGIVRNQENAATFGDWDDGTNVFDNPVAGEGGEDRQAAVPTPEDEQDQKSADDANVFDMDNPARNVRMYNFYEILCALANGRCIFFTWRDAPLTRQLSPASSVFLL